MFSGNSLGSSVANPNAAALSPWQKFGMGAAGGGMLGAGLMGMFGDHQNPAQAADPYFAQIPDTIKPYYQPYMDAGRSAMPQLQGQFNQLLNDPNAMLAKFGSGYQQSPGYQWQRDQGLQGINNAAAAGGMAGSPQHQQQAGQLAGNLANQDYYNYLNSVMGLYGSGLSGMTGLGQQGQQSADSLAQMLGSVMAQRGGLAYQGAAGENQANSQNWSNIFGGLGSLASFAAML